MAGLIVETPATNMAVDIADMKNFLRLDQISDDDILISSLIKGCTRACENHTRRSFINKGFLMTLDSFPYFTDTMLSQLAYPPSYYALPKYSTTLWNYSQMIKLWRPRLQSLDRITFMSSDTNSFEDMVPQPAPWYPQTVFTDGAQCSDVNGNVQTLFMGDPSNTATGKSGIKGPTWNKTLGGFTVEASPATAVWRNDGALPNGEFGAFMADRVSEPARVFPSLGNPQGPNGYWPSVLYIPNAVQLHYTAGYGPDSTFIPDDIKAAIMLYVNDCYENREPVKGEGNTLPGHIQQLLAEHVIWDMSPTRG